MRALIIAADGDLQIGDVGGAFEDVLGPEGRARVGLHPRTGSAGWVNDCGLLFPDRYPRSTVGACVLIAAGAPAQPYAGTVVITGWNPQAHGPETCDLNPYSLAYFRRLHADVRSALAGQTPCGTTAAWAQHIRHVAEAIKEQPTPTLTIRAVRMRG